MAGRLVDTDPELANQHAQAAKHSASRLPIVREAVGETAYAAGDYAEALSEFRALRRMTGTNEYLPAMADCERALGRTQAALKLIREGLAEDPEVPQLVELRLVEAGVRAGSGQFDEAMRLLQAEIEAIGTRGTKVARARLRYAYADYLEQAGQIEAAERWFVAAAALDPDETTDAADRVDRLRGIVIDFDDSEELDDVDGGEDLSEGEELDSETAVADIAVGNQTDEAFTTGDRDASDRDDADQLETETSDVEEN
jgi:tetratricopeptide (TPR) repeat protein